MSPKLDASGDNREAIIGMKLINQLRTIHKWDYKVYYNFESLLSYVLPYIMLVFDPKLYLILISKRNYNILI